MAMLIVFNQRNLEVLSISSICYGQYKPGSS